MGPRRAGRQCAAADRAPGRPGGILRVRLVRLLVVCLPACLIACSTPLTPVPLETCTPDRIAAVREALPAYQPSDVAEFVRLDDAGFVIGQEHFPIHGINYYPARYPWQRFLTSADTATIRTDFELLRDTGFNTVRLFLWNTALFQCPGSGAVPNAENFARLDAIIHEAAAHNLRLILTLNDLPDLSDYPLYDNPDFIRQQTASIVTRYRDEAAILAWDLRNEGDIDYGSQNVLGAGARFSRESVLGWLRAAAEQVRGLDTNHLITAGWLYDSESTAPYVDFLSFHHWGDAGALRDRAGALRQASGKPLLLEEFGFSTGLMTEAEQARRIADIIATAGAENLAGWMIWTAFDFPVDAACWPPPCAGSDNPEHHFGLWDADYSEKPGAGIVFSATSHPDE